MRQGFTLPSSASASLERTTPAVAAGLLGAGALGSAALADNPTPTPTPTVPQPGPATGEQTDTQERSPAYTGTITVPRNTTQTDGTDAQEAAALAGLATITADQARTAALGQFPGATVSKVSLDDENGTLVWSVELFDAKGVGQDVKVDAGDAKILHVEEANAGAED